MQHGLDCFVFSYIVLAYQILFSCSSVFLHYLGADPGEGGTWCLGAREGMEAGTDRGGGRDLPTKAEGAA